MILLCLRRKHNILSMHSTHSAFSRSINSMSKSIISALIDWQYVLGIAYTLLNRLYGVWQCDLFTWYFRFQNSCNRNKFVRISRWISGFYITKSCKERHWTPFYPPNTLRGREYHFPVVRMFLREFSHKQCAETSVHKTTHPAVTKMTIVNFLVNVLQHNFNKQF